MEAEFLLQEIVQNNNEGAFKVLFKRYYPALCLYCKRYIDDRHAREDIVQEVFITLWNKRNEIVWDNSAIYYLKACAKNSCLNYLTHQSYEQKYIKDYTTKTPAYDKDGDNVYTLAELQRLLRESLEKVSEECRKVYIMSYMQGKSNIEIAELMGISTKTVERYKKKSIEHLKKDLKDYLPLFLCFTGSFFN